MRAYSAWPYDVVVFDCGHPEENEAGGRVYEVFDGAGRSVARTADEAVSVGEYELTFEAGLVASWGRACSCHIIGCHLTQETRVQHVYR